MQINNKKHPAPMQRDARQAASGLSMRGRVTGLVCAWLLCLSGLPAQAQSSEWRQPPMPKALANRLAESTQMHHRLVIKFVEGSALRAQHGRAQVAGRMNATTRAEIDRLNRWLAARGLVIKPLFSAKPEELDQRRQRIHSQSGVWPADLNAYAHVPIEPARGVALRDAVQWLNQLRVIEVAYIKPMDFVVLDLDPPFDDFVNPGATPLLVNHQDYFKDAPIGVGQFKAWQHPGGTGAGVKVMVYDNNYRATHEDLPNLFYSSAKNPVDEHHGTAVLGIVGAKHNGIGLKGGVYDAQFGFQRAGSLGNGESNADNMLNAVNQLNSGDVMVNVIGRKVNALGFACPCNPTQANMMPLEFYPDEFDVVHSATLSGITVVQSAGNGCVDLDDAVLMGMYSDPANDSGSIWAGASLHDSRTPTCYSNSGARVDLHAWGESVAALQFLRVGEIPIFNAGDDRLYGPNFGGTSSAAPIIGACAASVQGQALAAQGAPLTPAEVKTLLLDSGQAQTGELNRPIGPMPNMEEIDFQ